MRRWVVSPAAAVPRSHHTSPPSSEFGKEAQSKEISKQVIWGFLPDLFPQVGTQVAGRALHASQPPTFQ